MRLAKRIWHYKNVSKEKFKRDCSFLHTGHVVGTFKIKMILLLREKGVCPTTYLNCGMGIEYLALLCRKSLSLYHIQPSDFIKDQSREYFEGLSRCTDNDSSISATVNMTLDNSELIG